MKKIIALAFLGLCIYTPAHAETLYGFLDGKLYDTNGTLKYICFLNGECLKEDNSATTRSALGLAPLEQTALTPTTPQTTTETVQNTPTQTTQQPTVTQPTQTVTPTPTPTPTTPAPNPLDKVGLPCSTYTENSGRYVPNSNGTDVICQSYDLRYSVPTQKTVTVKPSFIWPDWTGFADGLESSISCTDCVLVTMNTTNPVRIVLWEYDKPFDISTAITATLEGNKVHMFDLKALGLKPGVSYRFNIETYKQGSLAPLTVKYNMVTGIY